MNIFGTVSKIPCTNHQPYSAITTEPRWERNSDSDDKQEFVIRFVLAVYNPTNHEHIENPIYHAVT